MVTVVGQLEGDGGSTTTLVIGDGSSSRRARSGVAARGTVGHAVNNVHIGILVGGNVEVGDGEAALVGAARERRSRGAAAARARARASTGRATAVRAAARGRGRAATLGSSTSDAFLL